MGKLRNVFDTVKEVFRGLGDSFAPPDNVPAPVSRPVRRLPPPEPPPSASPSSYSPPKISRRLEEITANPVWDWPIFRAVLILLARERPGSYIPASRRPNWIMLDGLQGTLTELEELSRRRGGRETSRAILVDKERSCLVISGKTRVGSATQTLIDLNGQPGREGQQVPVLAIHVHPQGTIERGFSDVDYASFLSERKLIVMAIKYRKGTLLALKTSATRAHIQAAQAQRMIQITRSDFDCPGKYTADPYRALFDFNKAVCMEFGLTLYEARGYQANVAHRVEVTI